MPDPPPVNLFTRFVLENPYPLVGLLVVVAIAVGWPAVRDGRGRPLRVALASAVAAAATLGAGLLVRTSGERARLVTRELLDAVVAGDVVTAVDLFAADATVSVGSPRNPAYDRAFIERGLDRATRLTITENWVRALRGYSISGDEAEVHLGCLTDAGFGPTPSKWVLRLRREGDGVWRISRLTCVSVNNNVPPGPQRW